MKVSRTRVHGLLGISALFLVICYAWLAFGLFSDREFGGIYIFQKHQLSPRFYFYAPLGESDAPLASLSPTQQSAETEFHDFIEVHGGYYRKIRIL